MKIKSIKYLPYKIKLKEPFSNSKFTIIYREGYYLQVITSKGECWYGEASPLPGYSKETLNQVELELKDLVSYCSNNLNPSIQEINSWMVNNSLSPSTRYCIEQAIYPGLQDFTPNLSDKQLSINGLISLYDEKKTLADFHQLVNQGFETIKIKIGIKSFKSEIRILKYLIEKFPNVKIRLDANGVWEYEEAVYNLAKLEDLGIEYIEQPVSKLDELKLISEATKLNIAVDEAITCVQDAEFIIKESSIKYIVLKPMMLGYINSKQIIEMANKYNKNVIISSLFETVIGRSGLVFLASFVRLKTAHGLATASLFKDENFVDPYPIINGKINFEVLQLPTNFGKL